MSALLTKIAMTLTEQANAAVLLLAQCSQEEPPPTPPTPIDVMPPTLPALTPLALSHTTATPIAPRLA